MTHMKPQPYAYITIFGLLLAVSSTAPAALADGLVVGRKNGEVAQDATGTPIPADADATGPGAIANAAPGFITLTSPTFKPDPTEFLPFPDGSFVNVYSDPAGIAAPPQATKNAITLKATVDMQNAAMFPLAGNGNIKPQAGGGGKGGSTSAPPPKQHWAQKVAPCYVCLVLNNVNQDGGTTLSGNTEMTVSDPVGPLPWAQNTANTWPQDVAQRSTPFAYITATPTMPTIKAKTVNAPAGSTVEWSVQISYDKTVANQRLQTSIPNAANLPAGVSGIQDTGPAPSREWDIAAALPAPSFYGGTGALVWTLKKQDGTVITSGNIPFAIRGQNPADRATIRTRVDAEITSSPNGLRSTTALVQSAMDAIIQHESGGNQFNWTNISNAGTRHPNLPGTADFGVHNPDHSSDGLGVGLTQVTWGGMNDATRTGVTWNWQTNIHEGCALFTQKQNSAINWLNDPNMPGERNKCATDKGVPVAQVVIPNFPVGAKKIGDEAGADLSPELATAIKFYNGRSGPPGGDTGHQDGDMVASREQHPAMFWVPLVQGQNGQPDIPAHWAPAFMTAFPSNGQYKVNAYVEKVIGSWP